MSEVIKNRYEFVVLFDVENGNPNGDPDAGNMPRVDPESGLGLVTDVCLKRKIRNYVETVKEDAQGYKIYIKEDVPLNRSDREACADMGLTETDDKKVTEELKKLKKNDPGVDLKLKDYMCRNFYDIRTFGAVMTTFVKASLNCGQVRGPDRICQKHRSDHQPGSNHHQSCYHHRERCGKQEYRDGKKDHCSLRSVSCRRLYFRKSGTESNWIFRRRSGTVMGSDP